MICGRCQKSFDGDESVTLGWLREHAPEAARFLKAKNTFTGEEWSEAKAPIARFDCVTICPHCGHANDAPGFVEGDDIPHTCEDGTVICATRYIPPTQEINSGEPE